jgi:hypothetical protein
MAGKLPAWVVSNRESVRREAAPYRAMAVEERARHLAMAVRAAARLLESRADRDRVARFRDPLPRSTVAALAQLRTEARAKR